MKKPLLSSLILATCLAPLAQAQNYDRLAPKEPLNEKQPPQLPQQELTGPTTNQDRVLVPELKALVFLNSVTALQRQGVAADGLSVEGLPSLQGKDFAQKLQPFLGKPLTLSVLNQITREVVVYLRTHDRPVVDVLVPEQNINNGCIQIVVLSATCGRIEAEGNRYFSSALLRSKVRQQPNQEIRGNALLEDIAFLNENPFRQVDLVFARGQNPGSSDIILRTTDRHPWRAFAGYEDTGNSTTGFDRFIAGANWGNVFGTDQMLSYQLSASPDFSQMTAHAASYTIPLTGRRTVSVFGSYARSKPDLHSNDFSLRGTSWQTSLRLSQHLPSSPAKRFSQEVSVGLDFKRSDNNLEFGGTSIFSHATDVAQAIATYNASISDAWGVNGLTLTAAASPGGISANNHDRHFRNSRSGAGSSYLYSRATFERSTPLPAGFSLISRFTAQVSDSNLLSSEQLGFGGFDSLRGYEEREANGDSGWLMTQELHAPLQHFSPQLGARGIPARLDAYVFWDSGEAYVHRPLLGEDPHVSMSSLGFGFRFGLSTYVQLRADYGWQLKSSGVSSTQRNDRGHIGVTVAY